MRRQNGLKLALLRPAWAMHGEARLTFAAAAPHFSACICSSAQQGSSSRNGALVDAPWQQALGHPPTPRPATCPAAPTPGSPSSGNLTPGRTLQRPPLGQDAKRRWVGREPADKAGSCSTAATQPGLGLFRVSGTPCACFLDFCPGSPEPPSLPSPSFSLRLPRDPPLLATPHPPSVS